MDGIAAAIEHDGLVAAAHQPLGDVAAHPAKSDDPELHVLLLARFADGRRPLMIREED
jgi:hypothetical protein